MPAMEPEFGRIWRMFQETAAALRVTCGRPGKIKKLEKYLGRVGEFDRTWRMLLDSLTNFTVSAEFAKWNIPINGSSQMIISRRDGETFELDILLTGDDSAIAIEVKTTLKKWIVDEFIENRLKRFKKFLPDHRRERIYGAVAYVNAEEDADRHARERGLFVVSFNKSDSVEIKNGSKFSPAQWG